MQIDLAGIRASPFVMLLSNFEIVGKLFLFGQLVFDQAIQIMLQLLNDFLLQILLHLQLRKLKIYFSLFLLDVFAFS